MNELLVYVMVVMFKLEDVRSLDVKQAMSLVFHVHLVWVLEVADLDGSIVNTVF